MKIVLIFFVIVFGLIFLVFALVAGVLTRLFGKRRSPQDIATIQSLATLNADEKTVLAHSIQRNDPVIGVLSDQQSLDSLIAKGIIIQSEDASGVIDYRIAAGPWAVLSRARGL